MSVEGAIHPEPELVVEEVELLDMVHGFLVLQARSAVEQNRPLCRAVHAKGVCARAVFQVLDVTQGRTPALAARLAKGIYARPASYPATVRFSNSDPSIHSDTRQDIRGMAFCVDLAASNPDHARIRQDYSMQSAPALAFNDVRSVVLYAKVFGAPNQATALQSLPHRDQLIFAQTMVRVMRQLRQPVQAYQRLRYWSCTPFRHGPHDVVKYSAWPAVTVPGSDCDAHNPNALRDALVRHLYEPTGRVSFDFGLQFLDAKRMTYQGKPRDADFWIENAAIEWPESQTPFHTVARLSLVPGSAFGAEQCDDLRINVSKNTTADCAPLGTVNRVRSRAVVASQQARDHSARRPEGVDVSGAQ